MLLLHARADGQRRTVSVPRLGRIKRVDVWVGIDPDDVQVLVFLQAGKDRRT